MNETTEDPAIITIPRGLLESLVSITGQHYILWNKVITLVNSRCPHDYEDFNEIFMQNGLTGVSSINDEARKLLETPTSRKTEPDPYSENPTYPYVLESTGV